VAVGSKAPTAPASTVAPDPDPDPDPTPAFPSVLETPDVDSRDYAYDSLNRLVGSETSKGNTAEYAYDPAGNRVQATTTTDAGTTDVMASFNEANQLTGSTSNGASSSYGYDGNGNRTTQNENGVTTDFSYQKDNRLTGVSRDGRSTSYAYDGTGRQLNTTETSGLGSQTTKSVWNGTSIVQQSNPASGTSTLMRDAFGEVALQTADGKDASWALLDGLGTTAAQAVGGSVTQLSTFDDWGNQSFDTIGWNSAVNYTGETTDAGYGLNNYYSRTYDPTTGSWMSQDSWRGLHTAPQTSARYAYVTNNPMSQQDLLGFMSPDSMEKHANANNCTYVSMTECGRVVSSPPSIRVIEDYASDGGPHNPESWDPTDYVYSPSGEIVEIPARHVQGFDEGHPGYEPRDDGLVCAGRCGGLAYNPSTGQIDLEMQARIQELLNLPATSIGWIIATMSGATCQTYQGHYQLCTSTGWGPGNGLTVGNTVMTGYDYEAALRAEGFLTHETNHSAQWAEWGAGLFLIVWLSQGGAVCSNKMEQGAGWLPNSGYSECEGWR
jgi:RHS repeat-associated protein